MSQLTGTIDDFGVDAASLAGSLPVRLAALRAAGFSQAMLNARDLVEHPQGIDAALDAVRTSGLRVTGLRVQRGFEGLAGPSQAYLTDVAKSMLELCAKAGADTLVCISTAPAGGYAQQEALLRDLRKLAMLAVPLGIRIACEALSWGHGTTGFPLAWDIVSRADTPNLGLGLDLLTMLDAGTRQDDLDLLDVQKVFVVQLADVMDDPHEATGVKGTPATPFRVFPGEGGRSDALAGWVRRLDRLGFRGDYSFAVVNEDYRQMPPAAVARRGLRAAQWLGEDVLRRSVPLPGRMRLRKS